MLKVKSYLIKNYFRLTAQLSVSATRIITVRLESKNAVSEPRENVEPEQRVSEPPFVVVEDSLLCVAIVTDQEAHSDRLAFEVGCE